MPAGVYGHLSTARSPEGTPQFIVEADGAHIVDVDGNRYLDVMCGFGTNLLGYRHPDIDRAFTTQLGAADAMTGASPLSVELAEGYCTQVAHADWALFCKNGGDATSIALLTARAHRNRTKVLVAAGSYHGASTWSTPVPAGTLPVERGHFLPFAYNDPDSLRAAAAEAGDELAGIFVTPFRHDLGVPQELPDPDFARTARELCDEHDALLVLDDVRAGFRLARESSWHHLGVEPDVSCWGKSLANGHGLSAVMGNDRARAAAASIFVTGSFWHAAAPMAAALATLEVLRTTDYLEHLERLGDRLRTGLAAAAGRHGLALSQTGPVQMPLVMLLGDDGAPDQPRTRRFVSALMDRGVYFHPSHNMFLNAAMTEADIDGAVTAADEAFALVAAG